MNPQKYITKFTILIYQNSSYMYLYYLTYYYCRKYQFFSWLVIELSKPPWIL